MPPSVEPIREQGLTQVAAQLATMTDVDCWATPALVTRALLSVDQYTTELQTGPVFGVTRSSGSQLATIALPTLYHDTFRFSVECYVRLRDTVTGATWLERAWDDHVRCLLAQPILNHLVRDLRLDTTDTDDGILEPAAWFIQG